MPLTYSSERVLILGGTSGIGLALAQRLVAMEMKPVLAWRRKKRRRTAEEQLGTSLAAACEFVHLDLADRESVEALFQIQESQPDALVDLAQGDLEALIGSVDPARLDRFVIAHLTHRALILRQAARTFLGKGRGRAILLSSTAVNRSNPGQGFYAALKRSAEALYRNMGIELGQRGVTTVTLRPGYVDVGRGRRFLRSKKMAVPAGQVLSAGEVADALVFLLSDNAKGFNATELTMDGGLSAAK